MSAASGATAAGAAERGPGDLDLKARRRRQAATVFRLELRRSLLGGRALGLYLLALLPVAFFLLALLFGRKVETVDPGPVTNDFAVIFQAFILRLVVYLGCVEIFGNLIRREVLDRSLHYYFLAPLRRDLLAAAKFAAGLAVSIGLFGLSTLLSFALCYLPFPGAGRFLLHGPGLGHLAAYLGVTALACVG